MQPRSLTVRPWKVADCPNRDRLPSLPCFVRASSSTSFFLLSVFFSRLRFKESPVWSRLPHVPNITQQRITRCIQLPILGGSNKQPIDGTVERFAWKNMCNCLGWCHIMMEDFTVIQKSCNLVNNLRNPGASCFCLIYCMYIYIQWPVEAIPFHQKGRVIGRCAQEWRTTNFGGGEFLL